MRGIFLFLLFFSCSPNSLDDYRQEGEAIAKKLTVELKKVHTKEDLIKIRPFLRENFTKLAHLMVQAEKLQKKTKARIISEDISVSDELLCEMKRIYQIHGAQKIIEDTQSKALDYLYSGCRS